MNSDISMLVNSIKDSTVIVKQSFTMLSDVQINWKPAPDKWSIGECIEHLVVTNKKFFPAFKKIINGGHKNSFWQSFSPLSGLWGKMLLKIVSPEYVKKTKTASTFEPSVSTLPKSIIDDLVKCNNDIISYMDKFNNFDLKKIKIYSPVNKFITYSLLDALKIITNHEVRHINQAKRVMNSEGFPKI